MNGSKEIELHEKHFKNMKTSADAFANPRLRLLPMVEGYLGHKISGNVMDAGAGNGYAGVWLAKNRRTQVWAVEQSKVATQELIPQLAKDSAVNSNLNIINASYDSSGLDTNFFDFIICFGALHHSPNIYKSLEQFYKLLKPKAFLIMQEPSIDNGTSNKTLSDIYNSKELFAGEVIRHGDRYDRFYRLCEYQTAIYHVGFETSLIRNVDSTLNPLGPLRRIRDSIKRPKNLDAPEAFAAKRRLILRPASSLFVCQKPEHSTLPAPHAWENL